MDGNVEISYIIHYTYGCDYNNKVCNYIYSLLPALTERLYTIGFKYESTAFICNLYYIYSLFSRAHKKYTRLVEFRHVPPFRESVLGMRIACSYSQGN